MDTPPDHKLPYLTTRVADALSRLGTQSIIRLQVDVIRCNEKGGALQLGTAATLYMTGDRVTQTCSRRDTADLAAALRLIADTIEHAPEDQQWGYGEVSEEVTQCHTESA
ncbi:MAG: hypothetical protein WC977_07655 [Anaerovoracaceae bacterium]